MSETRPPAPRDRLARAVLGLWIFGVAIFYFVRFTFEFLRANQAAVESLWRGASQ